MLVTLAAALASSGCVVTVGGGGGAAASYKGVTAQAAMVSTAFGFGANDDSTLVRMQGRIGPDYGVIAGGAEMNFPVARAPRAFGLRGRIEGGAYLQGPNSSTALLLGVVPGVFYAPFHSQHAAHSFLLALEAPVSMRTGVDVDPNVRPIAGLMLLLEYWWTPCTTLGGASCDCGRGPDSPPCPPQGLPP
jgi:hypothetical protein